MLHKLLCSRRETQKAFRKIDGTAANLAISDTMLRDARSRLKPLQVAFIDLRKAFDSVSHDTIVRAAIRLGVPAPLVGYLRVYYQRSSTRLFDSDMVVTNGVRQGGPLSPLLFNAVLHEAICAVEIRMVGYVMNDHHFQVMAFADDMVLVASTARGLQTQTDVVLGPRGGRTASQPVRHVRYPKRREAQAMAVRPDAPTDHRGGLSTRVDGEKHTQISGHPNDCYREGGAAKSIPCQIAN